MGGPEGRCAKKQEKEKKIISWVRWDVLELNERDRDATLMNAMGGPVVTLTLFGNLDGERELAASLRPTSQRPTKSRLWKG